MKKFKNLQKKAVCHFKCNPKTQKCNCYILQKWVLKIKQLSICNRVTKKNAKFYIMQLNHKILKSCLFFGYMVTNIYFFNIII